MKNKLNKFFFQFVLLLMLFGVSASAIVPYTTYTYDVSGTSASEINHFYYPTQKGASPAGIDFVYRFSEAYINK